MPGNDSDGHELYDWSTITYPTPVPLHPGLRVIRQRQGYNPCPNGFRIPRWEELRDVMGIGSNGYVDDTPGGNPLRIPLPGILNRSSRNVDWGLSGQGSAANYAVEEYDRGAVVVSDIYPSQFNLATSTSADRGISVRCVRD